MGPRNDPWFAFEFMLYAEIIDKTTGRRSLGRTVARKKIKRNNERGADERRRQRQMHDEILFLLSEITTYKMNGNDEGSREVNVLLSDTFLNSWHEACSNCPVA